MPRRERCATCGRAWSFYGGDWCWYCGASLHRTMTPIEARQTRASYDTRDQTDEEIERLARYYGHYVPGDPPVNPRDTRTLAEKLKDLY